MGKLAVTNVRIEREKLQELKRRAIERNRSLGALIREIIDEYLGLRPSGAQAKRIAEGQKASIRRWAGASMGAGFDGRDHDDVLYGGRR